MDNWFSNFTRRQEEEDEEEEIVEYWFDQTDQQILIEDKFSGGAPGRGHKFPGARDAQYKLVATGLRSDSYKADVELASKPCRNVEQKTQRLGKYRTQKQGKVSLVKKANYATRISSKETLQHLMAGIDSKDYLSKISTKCGDDTFYDYNWLYLKTPTEFFKFEYSLVILQNFASHGLMHTFIRHWSQWEGVIPSLMQSGDLEPIMQHLNEIANATNEMVSKEKINSLSSFLLEKKKKEETTYKTIKQALFLAQMKIYGFLFEKINSDNYLGESVNDNCYVQAQFKVAENRILLVAISNQLYPPVRKGRPVRTITTVFFDSNKNIIEKVWKRN